MPPGITWPMPRNPASVARTNKTRGARCETIVCQYLTQELGRPIERRHLSGSFDRGDIAGIPGTVGEIKSGQPNFSAWLRELAKEMKNDGATRGFIWWAPPGYLKQPHYHVVAFPSWRSSQGALAPLWVPAIQMAKHVRSLCDGEGLGATGYVWNGLIVTCGWVAAEWLNDPNTHDWRAKVKDLAAQGRARLSDLDSQAAPDTPVQTNDHPHTPAAS